MSRGEPERYDVLLSHTATDAALAEAVRDRLTGAGLTVVAPFADIDPNDYEGRLRPALEQTRSYVAILSPASVDYRPLFLETAAAWAMRVPTFLLYTGVQPTEVSVFLERFSAYPLWKGFPKLVAAVRKLPERMPA